MYMEIGDMNVKIKIWLEYKGEQIIGPGLYRLLKNIEKTNSLSQAATECKYSYKYAWSKIKKAEVRTNKDFVNATKGGYGGGGSMHLTEFAKEVITLYEKELEKNKIKE